MMKWTIYWNSSIQNIIMIFWMLKSRCFRLEWWSPLLQDVIQFLLCYLINIGGANVAVTNCMLHFSIFFPSKATVKLANGNTEHAQGIVFFNAVFLTVPLYINGTSLLFSTSPFQHHLLRCPQIVCWFLEGYI